jgi:hypothetical protein
MDAIRQLSVSERLAWVQEIWNSISLVVLPRFSASTFWHDVGRHGATFLARRTGAGVGWPADRERPARYSRFGGDDPSTIRNSVAFCGDLGDASMNDHM